MSDTSSVRVSVSVAVVVSVIVCMAPSDAVTGSVSAVPAVITGRVWSTECVLCDGGWSSD